MQELIRVSQLFFFVMDLSGVWSFYEEFGSGFDLGYAMFVQNEGGIVGSLVYTEYIAEELPFSIAIEVKGEVQGDQLFLKGERYEIVDGDRSIHYCLDDRIAFLDDPFNIEGHSNDEQDMQGRFMLRRLGFSAS